MQMSQLNKLASDGTETNTGSWGDLFRGIVATGADKALSREFSEKEPPAPKGEAIDTGRGEMMQNMRDRAASITPQQLAIGAGVVLSVIAVTILLSRK